MLAEYALGLGLTGFASPPTHSSDGTTFELHFYAGRSDINYTVETSDTLTGWKTQGVSLSAIDANGYRTASTPVLDKGFLQISFEERP